MSRFRLLGQGLADNERVNIAAKEGETPLNTRQKAPVSPIVAPLRANKQTRTAKPQIVRQKKAAAPEQTAATLKGNCVVASIFLGIFVAACAFLYFSIYGLGNTYTSIAIFVVWGLSLAFIPLIYFVPAIRKNTRCPQIWALLFLLISLAFVLPRSISYQCYLGPYGEYCEFHGFIWYAVLLFALFPTLWLLVGFVPPIRRKLDAQGKLPIFPSALALICTVLRTFPWGVFRMGETYYFAIMVSIISVMLIWFVPPIRRKVAMPFSWLFIVFAAELFLTICGMATNGTYTFAAWPTLLIRVGPIVFFVLLSLIPPIHRLVFQKKG